MQIQTLLLTGFAAVASAQYRAETTSVPIGLPVLPSESAPTSPYSTDRPVTVSGVLLPSLSGSINGIDGSGIISGGIAPSGISGDIYGIYPVSTMVTTMTDSTGRPTLTSTMETPVTTPVTTGDGMGSLSSGSDSRTAPITATGAGAAVTAAAGVAAAGVAGIAALLL